MTQNNGRTPPPLPPRRPSMAAAPKPNADTFETMAQDIHKQIAQSQRSLRDINRRLNAIGRRQNDHGPFVNVDPFPSVVYNNNDNDNDNLYRNRVDSMGPIESQPQVQNGDNFCVDVQSHTHRPPPLINANDNDSAGPNDNANDNDNPDVNANDNPNINPTDTDDSCPTSPSTSSSDSTYLSMSPTIGQALRTQQDYETYHEKAARFEFHYPPFFRDLIVSPTPDHKGRRERGEELGRVHREAEEARLRRRVEGRRQQERARSREEGGQERTGEGRRDRHGGRAGAGAGGEGIELLPPPPRPPAPPPRKRKRAEDLEVQQSRPEHVD
ncbi:hypothetical protein B0T20DRAFT_476980 [Sordaria brevicollis]|uniref:Uncharacterized protein n=1 Tax=Sordaria brevicollis TaxID=83679 RepID=A0AAE0UEV9_SORBR|nr:hypothetical protein B0T20DRAFT_476980 [Sordaria brevicollis]